MFHQLSTKQTERDTNLYTFFLKRVQQIDFLHVFTNCQYTQH